VLEASGQRAKLCAAQERERGPEPADRRSELRIPCDAGIRAARIGGIVSSRARDEPGDAKFPGGWRRRDPFGGQLCSQVSTTMLGMSGDVWRALLELPGNLEGRAHPQMVSGKPSTPGRALRPARRCT